LGGEFCALSLNKDVVVLRLDLPDRKILPDLAKVKMKSAGQKFRPHQNALCSRTVSDRKDAADWFTSDEKHFCSMDLWSVLH
jgi:hypothetical protein